MDVKACSQQGAFVRRPCGGADGSAVGIFYFPTGVQPIAVLPAVGLAVKVDRCPVSPYIITNVAYLIILLIDDQRLL